MHTFDVPPTNPAVDETKDVAHERVKVQIEDDLRDLYRRAQNPLAVLLQTMETDEFRARVPEATAKRVRASLEVLVFNHEDEFISKVIKAAMPLIEIIYQGREDRHKQPGRELFTEKDVEAVVEIMKEAGAQAVYVVGNVGSGKTTFARVFSRLTGYRDIDLDRYFPVFRQERGREARDLRELVDFVWQKEKPPFVINHADILRQGLIAEADMVILLNPKKEEQLKSREIRTAIGSEGEWRAVHPVAYDQIAKENIERFEALGGELKYFNPVTGTSVRLLKR